LITSATPVMVPPVPTPEIRMSTPPWVSFQISSAVVRRWTSGLAGFSNCCGMIAFGMLDQLLGLGDGALHAFRAFGQVQFGAQQLQHLAPLDRHGFGHGQDQAIALGRGDEGQRNAGVARSGLDQRADARLDLARGLQRLDHRQADAVLHARQRVVEFQLGQDVGPGVMGLGQLLHPHQWGRADGVEDRVVDLASELGLPGGGSGHITLQGRK